MFEAGSFGKSNGVLMIEEIVKQALDNVLKHLGQPVVYTTINGKSQQVIAVIKLPETQYDLSNSQMVDQVAEVIVKKADITPKLGDYITVRTVKYKIFSQPLLDASNNIWKFYAVSVME